MTIWEFDLAIVLIRIKLCEIELNMGIAVFLAFI
jgi:hypothetical protein